MPTVHKQVHFGISLPSLYTSVIKTLPPKNLNLLYFLWFFSVRLLSVLRGHSFFHPRHNGQVTSDFEGFSIPDFIHYIKFYFPILNLEKEPVFPFLMFGAKQGNYLVPLTRELPGTVFITSLVWRGPWLRIEPGTSRTRCQHFTTRLLRRSKSVLKHWLNEISNVDIELSYPP